jgi:tungstate transport system substrate-binding protein
MGSGAPYGGRSATLCAVRPRTWIDLKNKGDLQILVEGDRRLFNQYGVILVNPAKHPNVNKEFGQAIHRLAGVARRPEAIANFKINGEQLFYPNAAIHTLETA